MGLGMGPPSGTAFPVILTTKNFKGSYTCRITVGGDTIVRTYSTNIDYLRVSTIYPHETARAVCDGVASNKLYYGPS